MSDAKGLLIRLLKNSGPPVLLACFVLGLACGCSGPLKVNYAAKERPEAAAEFTEEGPVSVFIAGLADGRSAADLEKPREIGIINATVFDISGNRLVIANDPAALVTVALGKEFAAAGYDVKTEAAEADLVLEGELKEFRLDIVDRDRIAIEVNASVKDRATGAAIWSGKAAERSDRYAGVMGNSKATIEKYINASLAKVAGSIVVRTTAKVADLRLARAPEKTPQAVEEKQPPMTASGAMSIKTTPARAKIYIGGVYYGLTPLTLELPAGVYGLEIKQKGYRDASEKVSVRKGETTEVEMELAGE